MINNYTLDNTTLSYDKNTRIFSYNFVFPKNIPVLDKNEFLIKAYDSRDPSNEVNSFMGARILSGACSEAILSAGKISLADGSWKMKYT